MHVLSESARIILDRMESDRRYDAEDLRAFARGTGAEGLREIMHELWIHRHVERDGYAGWRRHRSAFPQAPAPTKVETRTIKPEDLFDHAAFEEFFK